MCVYTFRSIYFLTQAQFVFFLLLTKIYSSDSYMGFNCTLGALIGIDEGILIKIGGKVKELWLFNMYLLLFQGTISNWTVDSKAVSWTGMGYSFIISTSIKEVKWL